MQFWASYGSWIELYSYLKIMYTCILGKIKDLVPQGAIDAMTRLVLVNAIYFKGNWEKKFPREATRDGQYKLNKVRFHALVDFFILSFMFMFM